MASSRPRRRMPCRPGIYAIINTVNGRRYVGSAVNISDRVTLHKMSLRRGDHHSSKLQRAWMKYGERSFVFTPLLECSCDNLLLYEQRAIDGFDAAGDGGYNVAKVAGAAGRGRVVSKETKAKLSAAHSGKKMSAEACAKMRARMIGYVQPAAVRAKISASMMGRKKPQSVIDALKARKVTDETRRQISSTLKGHPVSMESRERMRASRLAWLAVNGVQNG